MVHSEVKVVTLFVSIFSQITRTLVRLVNTAFFGERRREDDGRPHDHVEEMRESSLR